MIQCRQIWKTSPIARDSFISVCLSVCFLYDCPSACLSESQSVCLYICLPACVSVYPSVWLAVCLSLCLSICHSVCLSTVCIYALISFAQANMQKWRFIDFNSSLRISSLQVLYSATLSYTFKITHFKCQYLLGDSSKEDIVQQCYVRHQMPSTSVIANVVLFDVELCLQGRQF